MQQHHWNTSFLKQVWFPREAAMPENAVAQVVLDCLQIQKQMCAVSSQLHQSSWHDHTFPPIDVECISCIALLDLRDLLSNMPKRVEGIVVDFLREPGHGREIELALRLYAWSCFLQSVNQGSLSMENLDSFVDASLKALNGGKHLNPKVGKVPREDLYHSFVDVYRELYTEWIAWRKDHRRKLPSSFPAVTSSFLVRLSR